jgi:2-oxoglutarate ferredoxin oxidoreductase subunit delta
MTGNRQTTEASAGARGGDARRSAGAEVEKSTGPERPAGGRAAGGGKSRRRPPVFVVDPDLCKSCGLCWKLCPHGVLTTDAEGLPVATDPEACTRCLFCEQHCPDFALELVDAAISADDAGEAPAERPPETPAAGDPERGAAEDEGDD